MNSRQRRKHWRQVYCGLSGVAVAARAAGDSFAALAQAVASLQTGIKNALAPTLLSK